MSREEGETYLEIMRRRYGAMRGKKAKTKVLDEFCELSGRSRKRTSWFDGFTVNRFVCRGVYYADERGVKRNAGVLNQY